MRKSVMVGFMMHGLIILLKDNYQKLHFPILNLCYALPIAEHNQFVYHQRLIGSLETYLHLME